MWTGGCAHNEELVLSSAQEIGSPFECRFHSAPMEDYAAKVIGHFEHNKILDLQYGVQEAFK